MQIKAILQRLQFKRPVVGLFGIKPYLGRKHSRFCTWYVVKLLGL